MGKLFGTDGVRGEANRYPMNAEIAFAIGQAIVYILKETHDRPRIVIGKDTRISGYMLEGALESGITSMGGNPYLVGVLPTPGIAFIAQSMRADAGIVISASHNPYQDNGIKIFSGNGFKLSDEQEEAMEDLMLSNTLHGLVPPVKGPMLDCARALQFCRSIGGQLAGGNVALSQQIRYGLSGGHRQLRIETQTAYRKGHGPLRGRRARGIVCPN